ncbi:hypothetical protein GCM10009654_14080 [Streptomyces hebeiensis]|uniref:Uncharacterized protein n=1 Tax=Streptomyces hebeiensis TaxID=229486 RepID=A0ABN1UNC3_9ACTN
MNSPTVSVPDPVTTATLAPSTLCTTARIQTNLSGSERVQTGSICGGMSGTMHGGGACGAPVEGGVPSGPRDGVPS